jgi:hypothetical protein
MRRDLFRAIVGHIRDHDSQFGRGLDIDGFRADSVAHNRPAGRELPEDRAIESRTRTGQNRARGFGDLHDLGIRRSGALPQLDIERSQFFGFNIKWTETRAYHGNR